MSIPLRDPFFLHGRRSILQRAAIISLVLGGLASIAGWGVTLAIWCHSRFSEPPSLENALPGLISIATVGFVYAPLNRWNGRSWASTIVALPISYILLLAFVLYLDGGPSQRIETRLLFGMVALQYGIGLPLIRPRRLHFAAFLVSLFCSMIPVWLLSLFDDPQLAFSTFWFSGAPKETVEFAGVFTSWFCALAIPWGIPFWWPPEPKILGAQPS